MYFFDRQLYTLVLWVIKKAAMPVLNWALQLCYFPER